MKTFSMSVSLWEKIDGFKGYPLYATCVLVRLLAHHYNELPPYSGVSFAMNL